MIEFLPGEIDGTHGSFSVIEKGEVLGRCEYEYIDDFIEFLDISVQGGDGFLIDGLIRAALNQADLRGISNAAVLNADLFAYFDEFGMQKDELKGKHILKGRVQELLKGKCSFM